MTAEDKGEDRYWIVYRKGFGFFSTTAGGLVSDIDQARRWTSEEIDNIELGEDDRPIIAPEVGEALLGLPFRHPLCIDITLTLNTLHNLKRHIEATADSSFQKALLKYSTTGEQQEWLPEIMVSLTLSELLRRLGRTITILEEDRSQQQAKAKEGTVSS